MSDDVLELDDVAARALASIILEHTAAMLDGTPDAIMHAVEGLADDAAVVLDVAAAILIATSWIVGAGEVAPEAIFAASIGMQPDDPTDPADQPPVGAEGAVTGSVGYRTAEPVTEPPPDAEGPILADVEQASTEQSDMVAEAIRSATAALAAPTGSETA